MARHDSRGAAKDIKINSTDQIGIKSFHNYSTVEELSAFVFHSRMKDLEHSALGNTVLHEVSR